MPQPSSFIDRVPPCWLDDLYRQQLILDRSRQRRNRFGFFLTGRSMGQQFRWIFSRDHPSDLFSQPAVQLNNNELRAATRDISEITRESGQRTVVALSSMNTHQSDLSLVYTTDNTTVLAHY